MDENNPSTSGSTKKKVLGGFDKIALIFAVAILAYVFYQRSNRTGESRSDEVQIISNPKEGEISKKIRTYRPDDESTASEEVLVELAEEFSGTSPANPNRADEAKENQWKNWGLTEDESNYYHGIKERYQLDETVRNVKDWYEILKTSQENYAKVKSLFKSLDEKAVKKDQLDKVMTDESKANEVTSKMKEWFDISPEEVLEFTKKGKKALSDWAGFVEDKQKREKKNTEQ